MLYDSSAQYYDRIYSFKDYAKEVETLNGLIAARMKRPAHTLLDVGCGTGAHLAHLKDHYVCAGLDYSEQMIRMAEARLPGIPFYVGDMANANLGRKFDVVVCLFSAIGYMRSEDGLQRALKTMAHHLVPDGILIVEPWFHPGQFYNGHVAMLTIDEPEFKLVRVSHSAVVGNVSIMEMHHLVATAEGVRSFVEHHEMGLFSHETYLAAFRTAELEVDHDPHGLDGRGLYIGWHHTQQANER